MAFLVWIPAETRAKLKKLFNLNSWLSWGVHYPRYTEYTYCFLISNCHSFLIIIQVILWTEDNFYFIFDCRNSFNCKPKKLIHRQIIIFCSPSNALYLSEIFVQVNILNLILSLLCVPFSLGLISQYWISVNEDTSEELCK